MKEKIVKKNNQSEISKQQILNNLIYYKKVPLPSKIPKTNSAKNNNAGQKWKSPHG